MIAVNELDTRQTASSDITLWMWVERFLRSGPSWPVKVDFVSSLFYSLKSLQIHIQIQTEHESLNRLRDGIKCM